MIRGEPTAWAVVSGAGAAFLARGVAQLAMLVTFPLLFSASRPAPSWFPRTPWDHVAELAAGVVLARAGGPAAVAGYVLLELLVLLTALPGRAFTCARDTTTSIACDLPGMIVERWPLWLALLIGAGAGRLLARVPAGANTLLRAAGAVSIVSTVVAQLGSVWFYTRFPTMNTTAISVVFLIGFVLAGVAGGTMLARSPLARPLLLALVIVGPNLALAAPGMRLNPPPRTPSIELLFVSWAAVLTPLLAAFALFMSFAVAEILREPARPSPGLRDVRSDRS